LVWSVDLIETAKKGLRKIDKKWQSKILDYLEDPRSKGKALVGDKKGLWRYRVGDYRIICDIEDDKLVI